MRTDRLNQRIYAQIRQLQVLDWSQLAETLSRTATSQTETSVDQEQE